MSAASGAEIQCGLVVVGQAIQHIDMLLEGFSEFLASDSCPVSAEITGIASRDYQGALQPLGDGGGISRPENLVVLSSTGLLECHVRDDSTMDIRLLSPLRLFENGHLLKLFDFSRFARSLMRRVSALAYYYGAYEYTCDFKALSDQANAVTCTDGHFTLSSGTGRKQSGVTGYGSFRGDLSGLMSFLVLGMYVHAGKGASFGMGMYELSSGREE
ncbi:MAG: CRISPR system precrRNA processing endoribonuclease RAMP protein Cas6 [Desulfuromonadales bacterium]|nr:CRISPR system precrRNA processing endoribonuclease RAMP protein Cas6 [Desulfuromonadales bacterium]